MTKKPLILSAYWTAKTLHIDHPGFAKHNQRFIPDPGAIGLRKRGEAGIEEYWKTKNQTPLDGLPTGTPKTGA